MEVSAPQTGLEGYKKNLYNLKQSNIYYEYHYSLR